MKTLWDHNKSEDVSIIKKLGNTYTHPYITENIINLFVTKTRKYKSILEPSIGTGSFYYAIQNKLSYDLLDGYDIDERAIAKTKLNKDDKTNLYTSDFLLSEHKKYDLIITNPPYISSNNISGEHVNLNKTQYINAIQSNLDYEDLGIPNGSIDKKSDIYLYFFLASLTRLSEDGTLIFLCSDKWLDTKYGKILKKILTKNFKLESITSSNYYPFFRDETNAIITVISRRKVQDAGDGTPVKIYNIVSDKFEIQETAVIPQKEMDNLLLDYIPNLKNKLLFYYKEYKIFEDISDAIKEKIVPINKIIDIETSNLGYNILKDKLITSDGDGDGASNGDLFFYQKQARINKPANYKSTFTKEDLQFRINKEDQKKVQLKENNMYIGSILNKFPICCIIKEKTIQSSKYYSFKFKEGLNYPHAYPQELLVILSNNFLTIMNMEATLRDATKRSSKKNENGVVKEIYKNHLAEVQIFNPSLLTQKQIKELVRLYKLYENDQIFTLEMAEQNKNYMKLQRKLFEFYNVDLDPIIQNAKDMHYKRLKNLKYLGLPLEYPE